MSLASSAVMESILHDTRFALRMLARTPGFTLVALLTLAIGIGANATVFSFVRALLMRPAPGVEDPRRLVAIYTSDFSSGPYGESSYSDFRSIQDEATAFSGMVAAEQRAPAVVRVDGVVERTRQARVSGGYFGVLGVRPSIGRLIAAADCDPEAPPVAVLGHRLWQRAFGSDPAILGRPVAIDGSTFTIVGIGPPPFEGLELGRAIEVWTPLVPPPADPRERENRGLSIVARLRPGVSLSVAQTEIAGIAARLATAYPETNRGTLAAPDEPRPMTVRRHTRLAPAFRGTVATIGAILMGAVALVLLIACANIGGLLLSRATSRDREMAVRLALGAAPRRLLRQVLTESVVLGLAGGMLGLLVSLWTADLLPSFFPADQARMLDTSLDGTTAAFIFAAALGGSLLFGLGPALQAAAPTALASLRTGVARVTAAGGRARLRQILVGGQIAVSVVLLVAAALLVQSLRNAERADLGFGLRRGLIASAELTTAEFDAARGRAYYQDALDRVRRLPGIERAALVRTLPLSQPARRGFRIEGYIPQPGEDMEFPLNVVSHGYFDTLGVELLSGRAFDERDHASSQRVVVVNELLAKRYFGGDAVGRIVTDSGDRALTIVGIVRTGANVAVQEPPAPFVYYPLAQEYEPRMTLVARTAREPLTLIGSVRREMIAADPRVPVFRTIPFAAHLDEALASDRLTAALVAVCGGIALLLAAIGLYGVTAYAVATRRQEIGVRLALGARPGHIARLVVREGLGVTAAGLVVGLVLGALSSRALQSLLFGVDASDPVTYAAVPAFLATVAALAAWIPTRRALRVEPTSVLRQD